MYYAIMHETNEVIATGNGYMETSEKAFQTGAWDMAAGTVAPYYLTTIASKGFNVES